MSSTLTGVGAIERLKLLVPEFRRHGVAEAWLFGSRARGEAVAGSDWDLLVEFSHPPSFDDFMNLKQRLESALEGQVDVVSRAACKPRFMKAIGGELLHVA